MPGSSPGMTTWFVALACVVIIFAFAATASATAACDRRWCRQAQWIGEAAAALEQNCRFIQAKPDREACYKRQEEELAAKRRPKPRRENIALEPLREMRQEDDAVYRSINNICRGC